jgi:hypothetical protein
MIDEIDVIDHIDEIDDVEVFPLAIDEQRTLARCEETIGRGLQTYIEVGSALLQIRDQRLYRMTHQTYADYCNERWGMSRQRAYQLIDSSQVGAELSTMVDKPPKNEREAREIAKSAPADRPKVIARATELAGDKPRTAKHIAQAAAEIAPPDLPIEFAIIQRRYENYGHVLSAAWDGATQRYVVRKDGGTGVVMLWPDVLTKLEKLEAEPESPAPAAENAASYDAKAARDSDRLERAHNLITIGQHATARALLDQVEVSTYARDQLLATIPAGRSVTLALSAHDCAALRKEAKAFEKIGLPTKLPAIARALTLLIEGMAQ